MAYQREIIALQQAQAPFFVGIDLGGTGVKVGVVDDRGRTLSFLSIPTQVEDGAETASKRMAQAALEAVQQAGLKPADIAGVGLGAPGTMDVPAGMLVKPNNLKGWDNFPIRDRVAHHFGAPVTFANDANAAAQGEFWIGSGAEYPSLILLTLGTGVGGGIIIGDLMVDGENSYGGELGHVLVNSSPDAMVCSCGQRGHLEAYASATGLINRAQLALARGEATSIRARVQAGEALTPILLGEEADRGDSVAKHLIMETAEYLGVGCVIFMHTLDPAAIIIGGAMTFGRDETPLGREFLDHVRATIKRYAFPVPAERIVLRYAILGGDAGYIGAAARARTAYYQQKKR